MKKTIPYIIFVVACIVSLSAAFYSIFGLASLFSGAYYNVIVMASSLELAKLVTTAYLHEYWERLERYLKIYLVTAVIILAIITSAGIYGFLSAAYQETATKDRYHEERVNLLRNKQTQYEALLQDLKKERDQINSNIQTLSQALNSKEQTQTVDRKTGQLLTTIKSSSKIDVQKQLDFENNSRINVQGKINSLTDTIQTYAIQVIEASSANTAASELGPLKYLSSLTGRPMDIIVNWFLLLLIFVFDPLAIALILAALKAFKMEIGTNINVQEETAAEPNTNGNTPSDNISLEPTITEISEPEVTTTKRRRGRPIGSHNKKKPLSAIEELEDKLKSEIVAEPHLTLEVAQQLANSFPKKKKI